MPNTLTAVIPKLLAQGLRALRQQAIMPRLVNRSYEVLAGAKGSTVDIPIPSAIVATAVTPAAVPPTTPDMAPTNVSIVMDQWYEAPFYLTDKDMLDAVADVVPMQASEAIKALCNQVDGALMDLYKTVWSYAGVAGTTPFAVDAAEWKDARVQLNRWLAPQDSRAIVLDPSAEGNAGNLRAFLDASFRGDTSGIIRGFIGEKLGAMWLMDQNVKTHTAGTAAGATTNTAGYAAGVKTVTLASAGTGTILVGDIFTFAGHTQTYVVTAGDADVSNGGTVSFEPGLQVALAASAIAITLKATHVVNLAFHRDAFALASRPMQASDPFGLGLFQTAIDETSGLVLRLEVTREHKRTRFAYDILYGVKAVRPELAARIAG